MANVINKRTGQYLKSVNTPDYPETDWCINPTAAQLEQYKYVPSVDQLKAEKLNSVLSQANAIIDSACPKWKEDYYKTKSIKLVNKKAKQATLTTDEANFEIEMETLSDNMIAIRERQIAMQTEIEALGTAEEIQDYVIDFMI